MKSLIVYDSAFGNTKLVAERIAEVLSSKLVNVKDFKELDLKDIDLILVGSPINGWRPLPSIVSFLESLKPGKLNGLKATSFDTRVKLFIHGDAKDKIAKSLKQTGAEIITEPQAFYVKGSNGPLLESEIEKAKDWANEIKTKL